MTPKTKILVQSVDGVVILHISLSLDENIVYDEFSCGWNEFFEFAQKFPSADNAELVIEQEDNTKPEKLEAFVDSIFEASSSSTVAMHSFLLFRLRECEKIQFRRIFDIPMLEEKIVRLESDNVALQHVVMDLISTVDSLKSRLTSMEKNGIFDLNPDSEDITDSKDENDNNSTQSSMIISDSDPNLKMYTRFEREMDEFVRMLQPREAQISFRQEAASIMKSLIQKALKCNAFVISFSELKCFLPDDPIKMTVVLNHAALSTWHKVLYDRLVILSEQNEIRAESNMMPLDQTEMMFKIRDVRLISEADTLKITGLMDNLPFEIVGNGRVDLTMLAFFEEMGALVGNDHLLKRSVLLIRAWWWYESMAEGEKSPRDYLPDGAIWLMTTALFNVYHRMIVDPVQALYLFLKIYGSFDGRKEIVTLYGLKLIPDNAPHISIDRDDKEYLIPSKLFEKYYNVVNVSHEVNNNMSGPPLQQWKADNSSLVILNPFTMENITLEKLSNRKVEKIQSLFKNGLSNLIQTFDDMSGKRNSLTTVVFPQTTRAMLSGIARRDTAASSRQGAMSIDYLEMMKSPRDVYYVEVSQLWHEILFCNFILQGIVSESALLSLCAEVLTERRILPVGEVGKIVSDIVASPFLSSQLKEKFGGLKKFLEKYPEIFVFSKDHPFNPHVVLKRFLSQEQLEMVEAGTSLQAIFKAVNRQQQQLQQQQQQQQGHARHSSHGMLEAVQVSKKALQNRNIHLNNHNGNGRYDMNGISSFPSAAVGSKNLASRFTDGSEYSLTSAPTSVTQQQSQFNLDLSWKQPQAESRSSFNNGTTASWNDSFATGTNGHVYGGFGKDTSDGLSMSSGSSGIPRLRGVDENFSSRFRSNGSENGPDRFLVGNNKNRAFNESSSVSDSFGNGGISNHSSMFISHAATASSSNGFEQQYQQLGFFIGNNNSILNSPQSQQYSRTQTSQQQLGDACFSYSQK